MPYKDPEMRRARDKARRKETSRTPEVQAADASRKRRQRRLERNAVLFARFELLTGGGPSELVADCTPRMMDRGRRIARRAHERAMSEAVEVVKRSG